MSRPVSLKNHTNTSMADALRRAHECLIELDREGCTVHAIVMRGGRPVVLIETPPGQFIGAVRMHTNSQGKREALWMAEVASCRVEWSAPPTVALVSNT